MEEEDVKRWLLANPGALQAIIADAPALPKGPAPAGPSRETRELWTNALKDLAALASADEAQLFLFHTASAKLKGVREGKNGKENTGKGSTVAHVFETRKALRLAEHSKGAGWESSVKWNALLAIPLLSGDGDESALGVLELYRAKATPFKERDEEILTAQLNWANVAISGEAERESLVKHRRLHEFCFTVTK